MVTFTVYASAGDFDFSSYLAATTAFVDARSRGTNYFFSDTDIYGSTMQTRRNADGQWSQDLFLGGTTIGPAGGLRFAPDARLTGDIGARTVGQAMATYIDQGLSDSKIMAKLFRGDDVLVGNRYNDLLYGYGGEDILSGGLGQDRLYGGAGDDVIVTGGIGSSNDYPSRDEAFGEAGNDIIVLTDNPYFSTAHGGDGDDLIHIPNAGKVLVYGDDYGGKGGSDTFFLKSTHEFWNPNFEDDRDLIGLDPAAFPMLAQGITDDNIILGGMDLVAGDADDYLVVRVIEGSESYVFFDPDGSGPAKQQLLAELGQSQHLTARNFLVTHLDVPTGPLAEVPLAAANHDAAQHPLFDPHVHLA